MLHALIYSLIMSNNKTRQCKDWTQHFNRKHHPKMVTAMTIWRQTYHKRDKELDFETFLLLSQLPCRYCGRAPFRVYNVSNNSSSSYSKSDYQKEHGDFVYNGLDRLDNTKMHTPDNVVPCCKDCNWAKAQMTEEQFREWIKLVYSHLFNVPSSIGL
jgi:hypothetical protein